MPERETEWPTPTAELAEEEEGREGGKHDGGEATGDGRQRRPPRCRLPRPRLDGGRRRRVAEAEGHGHLGKESGERARVETQGRTIMIG